MHRGLALATAARSLRAALIATLLAATSLAAPGTLPRSRAEEARPSTRAESTTSPLPVGEQAAAPVGEEARRQLVIARGEGVEITVGEVEDVLAQQGSSLRARYRDPEQLRTLVSSLVRAELLANEAARRGYEQQAPVRYTAKDSAAQALVRAEVEDKITPQTIAADDVRAYYEAHPAEFHRTAMRRASQIVLEGSAEAAALQAEAQKADARAFAELAKARSKDAATKAQGGDLGYFAKDAADDGQLRDASQPKVPVSVRNAVFALHEVGDTTVQPIELMPAKAPDAPAQLAIVRFTAERPERHVTLDDAALSVRAKLWRERRQKALDQLYAKLRAKDKPQVFTDRIYQISFDDMEKRPSGFAPDPPPPAPKAQKASQQPQKP
jgi:parvulin-like peptidyl-prolyl isomerase